MSCLHDAKLRIKNEAFRIRRSFNPKPLLFTLNSSLFIKKLSIDTRHLPCIGSFQEIGNGFLVIQWVARFDAEKESVVRRKAETGNVKDRMIGRWQSIHCKHSDRAAKSGDKNGAFEGDRNI